MKTAFIGHRQIFAKYIEKRLISAVEDEIANGCKSFTMGTHGEFDELALSVCRKLRNKYKDLNIEVVLTSLHEIEKTVDCEYVTYSDVNTVIYEIEDVHFKRRITLSNRKMIDTCDTLICYVNENEYRSGAKTALRYAKRNGLKIVNLWHEQDNPFRVMTKEEIDAYMKELFEKLKIKN